jgi:YHS domain-containing protein
MKTVLTITLIICAFSVSSLAQETKPVRKDMPFTKKIVKEVCPVTGERANPKISYTYEGVTYHFCCEGCLAKFKEDPKKYVDAAKAKKFDKCTDEDKVKKMDAKAKEMDAKAKEMDAKAREMDAKAREMDAKAREMDVKAREMDVKAREMDAKAKKIESKAMEMDVKAREMDAKAKAMDAKAKAGAAKSRGVINTGKDLSSQIVNDVCPVMKKPVDKSVTTVTYNDKVYGFCCKSCVKRFAANPEKYLK